MPALLTNSQATPSGSYPVGEAETISQRDFDAIRTLLFEEAGISLSDAKQALVCSRLAKRLRHLNLHNHSEYLDYLANRDPDGAERQKMVNCLSTNKTDFFREPHHFDYLHQVVFPEIERRAAQGGPRKIRIWSAASSTGEEPYTIAISVLEHFRSLRDWDVRILASDINTEVLATAAKGIYPLERIEGVDRDIRQKYFLRGTGASAGFCQIHPKLRQLVRFQQVNLMDDRWPVKERCDVIFCRNVIIYFNAMTQRRLLPRLVDRLTERGCLILGHSENLHWLADSLDLMGNTIYRRKLSSKVPVPQPMPVCPRAPAPRTVSPRITARTSASGQAQIPRCDIHAGQVHASRTPLQITTLLGSCVAACLFDPQTKIGGMNHFMLPYHTADQTVSARYGVHAMELLINAIAKLGGDRRRLVAKVFGGSNVLRFADSSWNVGKRNAQFVRAFLATENIPILAERLESDHPLRIHLFTHTGKVFVKEIVSGRNLLVEEASYSRKAAEQVMHPPRDSVILF